MDSQNWNKFDKIHKQFEQMGGADGLIEAVKQEGLVRPIIPGQTTEELTCAMETMREEADKLGERNHANLKNTLNSKSVVAFLLIAGLMQHEMDKLREKDSLIG